MWQQVGSTLIGVVIGFGFSLLLFWCKEFYLYRKKKKDLLQCLNYEFEYNQNLFTKFLKKVDECIIAVNGDRRDTYLNSLEYALVASYFSQCFYREGLIIKYLHVENTKRWNDLLANNSVGSEEYIKERLEKWREEKISKTEIITSLQNEKTQLENSIEMIKYLKGEIFK